MASEENKNIDDDILAQALNDLEDEDKLNLTAGDPDKDGSFFPFAFINLK